LDFTGGIEFVVVLLLAVTVVTFELEVAADTGAALGVVVAAAFVAVTSEVRSIKPTFGDTRLGVESEAADAVAELLDPPSPAPQAAKPDARRRHRATLRMSERTTKAALFIDHYPG